MPDAPPDYMLTEEEIVESDDLLESRSPKRGRSMERLEEEVRDETQNKTKETENRPQVTKSPPLWGLLAFFLFLRPAYGVRIGPQPPTVPSPDSPRPHAWRYVWPQDNEAPDINLAEDDEPEGYIIMEQMRNMNKERMLLTRQEILIGFASMAVAAGVEALKEDLVGFNGKYGPYEIYTDMQTIEAIRAKFPKGQTTISHMSENGESTEVHIRLRSVRVADTTDMQEGGKGPSTKRETVHMVAFLDSGRQRRWVRAHHIRVGLKKAGLVVFRATHQRVKLEGVTTDVLTEQIHFDVKPRNGLLQEFIFPPHIKVEVTAKNHKQKINFETDINYKLWAHVSLPSEVFCLPCKMPRPCACTADRPAPMQRGNGPEPPAKRQCLDRAGTMAKLLAMVKSQGKMCTAFEEGKCRNSKLGKECPFKHTEGIDPFQIACSCATSQFGTMCSNGKTCLYKHTNQKDYDFKPEKYARPLRRPRRMREPERRRKRRRRHSHIAFNSTLGYPGEGPRFVSWNARGLAKTDKVSSLLRRAKREKWDVLLIQEVMWDSRSEENARRTARVCGFDMYASRGDSGHQGGSAVFIYKDSESVKVRGPARCDIKGYCAVPVWLEGTKARAVSLYVNPNARIQSWFLRELKKRKLLHKDDIVGGDFNCVADPVKDAQRDDGTCYDPTHGTMCEMILTEVGLADTFRIYHGEEAKDYTRFGPTVRTRLDRIYTRKYQAHWRLTGHSHYHTLLEHSDHSAVVVKINVAKDRDPSPHEEKIDPSIMRDPEVRKDVGDLWRQAIAERPEGIGLEPGYLRGQAWEHAKSIVAQYLLAVTGDKRREAQKKSKAEILRACLAEATKKDSVNDTYVRIKSLQEQLKAERKKEKTPSPWWAYIQTLREETSSKVFFSTFKAKHASPDISSVHTTPDWNDPETKGEEEATTPEPIAEELKKYYDWLFQAKPSAKASPFLNKLRERKILAKSAKIMEAPVEEKEARSAIRKLALGKAPGPDLLGAEFYKEFEDLIVTDYLAMLQEAHEREVLPKAVRDGTIILIYKKGDTRDVRNYRPITLLNLDYKIMSKILVARLSLIMDEIVSPQQLGFVPGRVITEATHLVKLVQALADEEDEEGLIIAADWEKAFDRVSWDYLHEAIDALGFGPNFKSWMGMMYNEFSPPSRRVKVNGVYSAPFMIRSGTPQGCPASPLIFLLVAEALSRTIMQDGHLQGVRVGGRTVKLSQFADDTQFFLKGYEELKRMWKIINKYEEATGMRANKLKFTALRLGCTRRMPVPDTAETRMIKFVTGKNAMTLLGVPFWEGQQHEDKFFEQLYAKVRCKIACWNAQVNLTTFGRSMLANSMVLSRFRYWTHSMKIPDDIMDDIVSDIQALVWQKNVSFAEGETGSTLTSRRWLKANAQFGDRKHNLGIGLLDWKAHVDAIQIKWLLNYRDATRGEWKLLLDSWLARHDTGRGGPFTSIPINKLIKSTTQRVSALPPFWISALQALKRLPLTQADPRRWLPEDARAHPLWDSPIFNILNRSLTRTWRQLETRKVGDLFKADGSEFSEAEILSYFDETFHKSKSGAYWILFKQITPASILRNWRAILGVIPARMKKALLGQTDHWEEGWRYSVASNNMMKIMGWLQGGLGKREEGISTPLQVGRPRQPGLGLGHPPTKAPAPHTTATPKWAKATRAVGPPKTPAIRERKPKQDHLRAVATEEGREEYGYPDYKSATLKVVTLTIKGDVRHTGETAEINPDHLERVVRWRGKVMGSAATTFPHPKSWRLGNIDKDLDRIEVKDITRAISEREWVPPSCLAAWLTRLGQMPDDLGHRYNNSLLTPKDWSSHFRNVLHRNMWVKGHDPDNPACRCCKHAYENIQHFATCERICPIFETLAALAASSGVESLKDYDSLTNKEKERFALFAITPRGARLEQGWINFHLLLWKYLIHSLTVLETENTPFQIHSIWQATWQRFERKALAKQERTKTTILRMESRGEEPHISPKIMEPIAPLASFNAEGSLIWNNDIRQKIVSLTKSKI